MKRSKITFIITDKEEKMLEGVIIYEPWLQENLNRIKNKDGEKYITFDAYDLFDAVSALTFFKKETNSHREKGDISLFIKKMSDYLPLVKQSGQKLGT